MIYQTFQGCFFFHSADFFAQTLSSVFYHHDTFYYKNEPTTIISLSSNKWELSINDQK